LGGTYEYGVGDNKVDEGERKRIMDMCCWLEPALKVSIIRQILIIKLSILTLFINYG